MNNKSSNDNFYGIPKAPAALISDSGEDRFYLMNDIHIIGRSENAFICLQDSLVSRKHCVISKEEDNRFTICDLSIGGTLVNDKKLVKRNVQELHHKDTIKIIDEKYTFHFLINKKLKMSPEQSEYINSQMQEQMLSLDTSHSIEMKKVNIELCKIDSEKSVLRKEMNSKLKAQEEEFEAEKLRFSNLVTSTQQQKDHAELKLKEMKERLEAEEKKLKDEVESKYEIMLKKEEELQQLKIEMELKLQKDKKELEERCQEEINELKVKLVMSEMEQGRLQEETRDAKERASEYMTILLESEIEQTRLAGEKDEVETKLIDLTKESTHKDDVVRDLQRKLEEKEKEAERVKKEMETLEEHLVCSICAELFIEPIVLNCGHMFCKTCIEAWKTKKKTCPMCRVKITGSVQVYNLDSIIEKNVALLSSEAKEHRQQTINNRKKASSSSCKKKHSRRRAVSPYRRPVEAVPRHMIPMVQINEANFPHAAIPAATTHNHIDLVADPFAWRTPEERRPPIPRMEPANPIPEIDLTNILEPTASRSRNATVTSSTIDLTTP